jgi:glucokinase
VSVVPISTSPQSLKSRTDARYPLLVADIGGTNVRFGWVSHIDDAINRVECYRCADYAKPEDAALEYLRSHHENARPVSVSIGVASVISSGVVKLTNSNWALDRVSFASAVGARRIDLFNDFEAIALGLPFLTPADYRAIDANRPDRLQPMGVVGAGTGLGVAGVLPVRDLAYTWQTVCGEGGHTTLAATNDFQAEVLRVARTLYPHVSAERLVSGLGLPTLRSAVAAVEGFNAKDVLTAEEIGDLGASRQDALCIRTLDTFAGFMGIVAGNLALTLGARGGVFIAGGIVPKIADFFATSSFREHFTAKGRYVDYLKAIATPIITAPYPGLDGLVRHAKNEAIAAEHEGLR